MRRVAAFLSAIGLIFFVYTPVLGAAFTDDMNSMEQNTIKSYTMLIPFLPSATSAQLAPFPDKTAFTLPAGTSTGWAQYRIQGAKQLTVGIYSCPGTFVSEVAYEPGTFVLGSYDQSVQLTAGRMAQASFSPANRAVYTSAGGRLQKLYASPQWYHFADTQDSPGDLIGYGVNVYVSTDGSSFSRIAIQQASLYTNAKLPFCYEEYSGLLPASARYVRVEINDFTQLSVYGTQKVLDKTALSMTCLTSVTFSGDLLTLGVPEPAIQSSTSSLPEIQLDPKPKTVQELETLPKAGSTAASASQPKFEGVIIQSFGQEKNAPSSKASSAKASRTDKNEKDSTGSTSSAPLSETPEHDVRIYEVPRAAPSSDRFTAGVTAYTVVIAGAIVVIALLPRK